ncbi:tripartite tricarboxylate transporter TctB family protein [Brevibacillus fulvus]|uniref:Tricarboxylic transport membrane protein n=1 Tax=Brevibacillus fulvus TaxID=1125967 RepID=A0A938Y0T7_9BACL|nr:tripartite tricarboxylate transporter TctB family protein [Brevibacillus fulvus]MBM7591834.1 putative tricarboxylic transport membrane protein [Brevibacillus fulvus]
MIKKIAADQIGGLISILMGIFCCMEAYRLHLLKGGGIVGDDTLPAIIGAVLIVLGSLLLFMRGRKQHAVQFPPKGVLLKMLLCMVFMFAQCLLIPLLGYLLSTLFVSWGLFRVIGGYAWLRSAIYAILLTAGLYLIFIKWLQITFPAGVFF